MCVTVFTPLLNFLKTWKMSGLFIHHDRVYECSILEVTFYQYIYRWLVASPYLHPVSQRPLSQVYTE